MSFDVYARIGITDARNKGLPAVPESIQNALAGMAAENVAEILTLFESRHRPRWNNTRVSGKEVYKLMGYATWKHFIRVVCQRKPFLAEKDYEVVYNRVGPARGPRGPPVDVILTAGGFYLTLMDDGTDAVARSWLFSLAPAFECMGEDDRVAVGRILCGEPPLPTAVGYMRIARAFPYLAVDSMYFTQDGCRRDPEPYKRMVTAVTGVVVTIPAQTVDNVTVAQWLVRAMQLRMRHWTGAIPAGPEDMTAQQVYTFVSNYARHATRSGTESRDFEQWLGDMDARYPDMRILCIAHVLTDSGRDTPDHPVG